MSELYSPDYQAGYNAGRASKDARIAALTQALEALVGACSTGETRADGSPSGVRMPSAAEVNAARAALAAVGEKKP